MKKRIIFKDWMNQGYERHLTNDLDCDIVMRIREEDDDDLYIRA